MAPRSNIKRNSGGSQYGNLYKYTKLRENLMRFVRAGVKSKPKEKITPNALTLARDWERRADLETRLKFSDHIAQTSLRPDIVIFSNKIKKIFLWELTVPWEEHLEEPHERKQYKYDELQEKGKNNGWHASCMLIEVGSRDFVARSLCKALSDIDLAGPLPPKNGNLSKG